MTPGKRSLPSYQIAFSTELKKPQPSPTICVCNFFKTACTLTGIDPKHVYVRATSWSVPRACVINGTYGVNARESCLTLSLTNRTGRQRQSQNVNVRRLPIMFLEDHSGDKLSPRFLGPHVDFDLVKEWILHCCAHHQTACLSDTARVTSIPGFKLIDCSSRRLLTLSEMTEVEKLQFIALSYVWRSRDASDIALRDVLPTQIPKVIDDAIAAT